MSNQQGTDSRACPLQDSSVLFRGQYVLHPDQGLFTMGSTGSEESARPSNSNTPSLRWMCQHLSLLKPSYRELPMSVSEERKLAFCFRASQLGSPSWYQQFPCPHRWATVRPITHVARTRYTFLIASSVVGGKRREVFLIASLCFFRAKGVIRLQRRGRNVLSTWPGRPGGEWDFCRPYACC